MSADTLMVQAIFQVIEDNSDRFDKLLMKLGYVKQAHKKQYLTTKEMCAELGICYKTWKNLRMSLHPDIVPLVDTETRRDHLFDADDLPRIQEIWRNRKK